MNAQSEQEAVIAFLSRPEHYGRPGAKIERIETHGAIVFLIDDEAYKLKRAVKYPYMDYSTPQKRQAMCEREFEINRRIAPQIYLGVRSVLQGVDGYLRFGPDEAAAARDHVVVMRRFPQETLFGRLCEAGKLTPELMRALAETLARFHETAEVSTDFGGAQAIAAVVHGNNAQLRAMTGAPFAAAALADYARASEAALKQASPLLDARRAAGRVRRCHGDLHLDNVILFEGRPLLFDAIEFDDAFAVIDVLYDLAFLLMDLEMQGARPLANALLNRYLDRTADYDGLAALPLLLSCRAAIRAHVSVSRARAKGGDRAALEQAKAYLELARAFLTTPHPRLVAIGGLSGTGKTTVARAIAPAIGGAAPGAIVLRSDVTRKRLMGVAERARLPQSAYAPEVSAKVFGEMAATARRLLAGGHAVVMDAVYGTEAERAQIAGAAADAGAPFDGFWLTADPAILIERIAGRRGDASDATAEVLQQQIATIAAPPGWNRIDASGAPEAIARDVLGRLHHPHQKRA